ncbi:hypothetical protein JCM11641_008064 [Rhodosporidiobolus odoratus]
MRSYTVFASALALAVSVVNAASSTPCQLHSSSFGRFDINGLRKAKQDYVATDPDGGAISLNFCGPVSDQASPAESAQGYGAYIEDSRGGISLGEYSTSPQYHNGHLSLTYKNGAACPNSNARRSSLIYLQCDNSWTSDNRVSLIDSLDDCTYFFTIKSPLACPVSGGGFFSFIWACIVVIFWLAVVIGGAYFLYNRFCGNKGDYTLGGGHSSGNAVVEAVSWTKDIVVIAGIWALDTAQTLFSMVKRRREANAAGVYNYQAPSYNNYQPAASGAVPSQAPSYRSGGAGGNAQQPDYSSDAWRATPPAPPSKSPTLGQQHHQEPTNPALAGGGSLLEDDEEEDEATLAMPGTQGKEGSLV